MLPPVILSRQVCSSPSTMVSFHRHRCWLLFLGGGFFIAHECDHWFGSLITSKLIFWSNHIVAMYPPRNLASGLVLYSGYNTINNNWSCSDTAPISPLLAVGGPPVKKQPGPIIWQRRAYIFRRWETRRTWFPPCCGHRRPGFCPCRNRLATEAYPRSILPDGRKYREWKEIYKVQPSSRGDSPPPPPGRGYRSTLEVERSDLVALTCPVVVDPLLIVIFWGFSVIPPHR